MMILEREKLEKLLTIQKEQGILLSRQRIAKILKVSDTVARSYWALVANIDILKDSDTDEELLEQNVRLAKQKQRYQDSNRIERKSFREFARIENAVLSYAEAIEKQNRKFAEQLKRIKVPAVSGASKSVGVIQISDWHANELISLPHNQYDFSVLSARAKKLADESIRIFTAYGIKDVLIAATGDMMNNSKRLDELLNQATNRAKASILVQHVLRQFIMHIRQHFRVNIVSVMGNESRMTEHFHSSNSVVSDNYDFTIFANLKQQFELANIDGIKFGSIDKMEQVVDVNGQNWLLRHDVQRSTSKQNMIQSVIGKYSLQGNPIDFVLAGHIHATRNTDISSRSSSMAGSNEYNEHFLGLIGRACQNIFVVSEKSRYSIAIDLQNVDVNDSYDIVKELEAYNSKSHDKTNEGHTVFKVVI